jgi:N-acetylglucosaminyl-diphospho-decaprenol L-rhamnosyltransferase
MPASNISLIIVNYNTNQLLLGYLNTFVEDVGEIPLEIWVVDNASTDESLDKIKSYFPDVHLITNDTNQGYAKANNQILAQANGEIFILLNPDTIVRPGALNEFLRTFESDGDIGVIGPQVLNPNGSIQPSCGKFASVWTEFLFQSFLFKIVPSPFPLGREVHWLQQGQYKNKHEVDWVTGACLAIRKEVIDKIGLLDEAFFMYGEDMDWCWRVKKVGYKVCYQPAAKIVHYSRQASSQDFKAWIRRYTKGQLRFIEKTHSYTYKALCGLWICLGSFLRIILWSFIRSLKADRRNEAQQRIAGYYDAIGLGWQAILRKPR